MKRLLTMLVLFAIPALAADISGSWKGIAEGPMGTVERTFVFKVDGDKLTGETTSSMFGKSTITDGKIEGDTFSFTITLKFQDNEMKLNYKGKVEGKELKMTTEIPGGDQTMTWVAKRAE